MERCPTCNARYTGGCDCHRCGTGLKELTEIEASAEAHLTRARTAFAAGDAEAAFAEARRACALRESPAAARLLAISAIKTGRFGLALGQWRKLRTAA